MRRHSLGLVGLILLLVAGDPLWAGGGAQITGLRISQTGNTGLTLNADVTVFYDPMSTTPSAYLGTYYNYIPALDWGDGNTVEPYGYGPSTGIPLVATSSVVDGRPANVYRGSFSHTYGAIGSYTVTANSFCCPTTATLITGTIFMESNYVTTGPFGPTTVRASGVRNTLDVVAVTPGFSKMYAPAEGDFDAPTTLIFTIDNTGSTLDVDGLDFTENLPAGLTVASPADTAVSCTGGTLTADPGTGTITYTGGEAPAGGTCTVQVDVQADAPGEFIGTATDLTSTFGDSSAAAATFTATGPAGTVLDVPSLSGAGVMVLTGLLGLLALLTLRRRS